MQIAKSESMQITSAMVRSNALLCREHYRLTMVVPHFPDAAPGQFLQLTPASLTDEAAIEAKREQEAWGPVVLPDNRTATPLLPRAFSIGGLRRTADGVELDVVYRVVGTGTSWMAGLRKGEHLTVLGPCGNPFPLPPEGRIAHLVIGGVGLPPLLWFADQLHHAGRRAVGLIGARERSLLPLGMEGFAAPSSTAVPSLCAGEFAAIDTPLVVSTDDGSCGMHGNVVEALRRLHGSGDPAGGGVDPAANVVVYTCGPDRMMRATADYCHGAGIPCFVCLERPMACGVGTCQSCIVTVKDDARAEGWRYALCCQDGPVFPADTVIW